MIKRSTALLLGALLVSAPVVADEYMFTYSKLFSQLKNNTKEGHDDVRLALFFNDAKTGKACNITKAWMEKEEHYEEFSIPESQELPLPLDNNLRSANPLVYVHTEEGKQCDIAMEVLVSKDLTTRFDYQTVENLLPQMQKMMSDLGGMFSSWFMPDVEGVVVVFNELESGTIAISEADDIQINNGRAIIKLADLNEQSVVTLPIKADKVMPWIPQS
ncbi:DUF2987 domain-containing protein [Vibrio sp. Of7-15]|uniref:DUF2987 domain-containing protein n=1 Tax=Vibrio sp. Of7-15 TaxID=2724879 RepID=UPI001EF32835|nr:DUF2987 domain-containing protein [Vibrio sp. Of7-15]MCG7496347.1 DUF2987 domain-containing protein [Vibrio sp. Of7-15]